MSEKYIQKNSKVIDIGSGAGFPSILLKIIRKDLDFTLVDSVLKKTRFLKETISALKLEKTRVIHSRSEDLARKEGFREAFDVCVARAGAELNVLCEYCLPFVKRGGLFIAYKSKNTEAEIERSKKAISVLGGELQEVHFYNLDADRENCLVIIKKVGRTPDMYPRRNNKPRLAPIL